MIFAQVALKLYRTCHLLQTDICVKSNNLVKNWQKIYNFNNHEHCLPVAMADETKKVSIEEEHYENSVAVNNV